jgi:hypothetical protein
LKQAVTLLSRKPTPDYRNSIKESISAVEAICAAVTGDPKATLGQALKIIDSQAPLHGALRSAFEKLYGYTSDADGIRHALLEDTTLEQEDAVFMLVACSAFVSLDFNCWSDFLNVVAFNQNGSAFDVMSTPDIQDASGF